MLVSVLLHASAVGLIGLLVVIISAVYGKLTGHPPSTFVDDTRPLDLVWLIGMLVTVIGAALGLVGLALAAALGISLTSVFSL